MITSLKAGVNKFQMNNEKNGFILCVCVENRLLRFTYYRIWTYYRLFNTYQNKPRSYFFHGEKFSKMAKKLHKNVIHTFCCQRIKNGSLIIQSKKLIEANHQKRAYINVLSSWTDFAFTWIDYIPYARLSMSHCSRKSFWIMYS